jgi:diacylglycerol kinase (ATP)
LLPRLRVALEARGADVYVSSDADDGRRAARDAYAGGRGVVACGGDGTVCGLAGVAAEAGGPLAILPTGAGNDFARHLGLDPRRPIDAADLLETGRQALVDLGRIRLTDGATSFFTTVANTGFDAEANRWANGVRWATGTTLYVLAVLRTLARYRPQPVRVRVDEQCWEGDAWLVAVGNSRYYAGGMMITPGAEVDDGLLDVCVLGPASVGEFLWRFPSVFKGRHVEAETAATFRGAKVELDTNGARIPLEVWASGERIGPLPASIDVTPAALSVTVPEESPVLRRPPAP